MAVDLIKEYLVGIGFKVDESSFSKTKSSMNEADKTINQFNKNSQKGFIDTNGSLKDLFDLFKSSSGTLGKLFPELQTPLSRFIRDIALIKKLYTDFAKEIEKTNLSDSTLYPQENEKKSNKENKHSDNYTNRESNLPSIIQNTNELTNSSSNLVEQILNAQNAAGDLAEGGGNAFKLFSIKAIGPIAVTIASITALVLVTKGLAKYLNDLANKDIEYEKLSRQLWTTKENAKEVDMALKTLGASMQDLWLSPTLLKQFNQLRKDSKDLKLPKEYTENLKVVQGIGLEFKRLRQLGQLALQWIANYILKYAAGPLRDIKQGFSSFNNWLKENIPGMGKWIGSIIGFLIRILSIIIKIGVFLFKLMSPIFALIKLLKKFGEMFDKLPEPAKKSLQIIGLLILALAAPILLVLGLLDDLMTYFSGGKSLTGTLIDKFNKELDRASEKIKSVIDYFRNLKKEILNSAFFKGINDLATDFKEGIDNIKNLDFKGLILDTNLKIKAYSDSNIEKATASYSTNSTTNSSSVTTQNSNNNIQNENKIYVYGGNDANSTGRAVKNNVAGITTRNLQGVF